VQHSAAIDERHGATAVLEPVYLGPSRPCRTTYRTITPLACHRGGITTAAIAAFVDPGMKRCWIPWRLL